MLLQVLQYELQIIIMNCGGWTRTKPLQLWIQKIVFLLFLYTNFT